MKDFLNFRFQQPYQQVMYNCSMLLEHKRWHINEFIEVLPSLEARDLTAFFPRILSRVFFECFIAGMGAVTLCRSFLHVFLQKVIAITSGEPN
jgi:insulysin